MIKTQKNYKNVVWMEHGKNLGKTPQSYVIEPLKEG